MAGRISFDAFDFAFLGHFLPGDSKKFTRLPSCGIDSMRPIFKTEMLIYHSKANLDEKILFGKITHYLDPKLEKCW